MPRHSKVFDKTSNVQEPVQTTKSKEAVSESQSKVRVTTKASRFKSKRRRRRKGVHAEDLVRTELDALSSAQRLTGVRLFGITSSTTVSATSCSE